MTTRISRRPLHKRAVGIVATVGAVMALSLTGVGAANAADRVTFADSVPSWATPANDAGAAPAEETFEGEIYLPLRDQQGAEALAKAVSSPVNLAFRKALNPSQWIKRFSPTQADSDAIVSFLKDRRPDDHRGPRQSSVRRVPRHGRPVRVDLRRRLHSFNYAGRHLVAPP